MIEITVTGIDEVRAVIALLGDTLRTREMLAAMHRATLVVSGDAMRKAPVDTGRLRASIQPEVGAAGSDLVGIVGSNVKYAPFQELGTRPHFVPARYIGRWAERHGLGYRGVFVSGRARPFLRPAFDENVERIERIIGEGVSAVVRSAGGD